MDRREIGLKLTIDALGLPFQMSTFEDRLILQKVVYLAQTAGARLGYFYNWYLHGPYCPALAEDAFSVKVAIDGENDESEAYELAARPLKDLERIKNFAKEQTRASLARRLELLASVHFLIDRKQISGRDPETIVKKLKRFGKDFDVDAVTSALTELDNCGLLSQPNT